MVVTDLFAGELATELIRGLLRVGRKCTFCRSSAEQLIKDINELQPAFREIQYSGVELPQQRQQQIQTIIDTLKSGTELCAKILSSTKWNVYKNLQYARKLEKMEKTVAKFISGPLQVHQSADLHAVRLGIDRVEGRLDGLERLEARLEGMGIGVGNTLSDGWVEDAMKRRLEEEARYGGDSVGSLVGSGMVLAKKKVKEMVLEGDGLNKVVAICGIGGSGKTTLATEISRDPQVRRHYDNRVFWVTVSQSPDVEQLRQKIWVQVNSCNNIISSNYLVSPWQLENDWGVGAGRSLVILDDVWSLPVLEKLIFNLPGCKTLVVSRFKFPTVFNSVYEVELLKEEEALSLFCSSAFGQKSIPPAADRKLVEQVVMECKGLPLALKVIGASLRDQHQMFWTSAKNRLSRGESVCESHEFKLLERMQTSIAYLPEKVKECFLDLAAFPEDKKIPLDVLVKMWVEIHDLDEEEVFAILVELSDKNLITLVKDARAGESYSSNFEISVVEHDVLRDMSLHYCNRDNITERRRLLMPRREECLPKEWERNVDKPFQAQIVSVHTGEMNEWDWSHMDFPKAEVLILNFSSGEYYLPPFINRMPKLRALVVINCGNTNAVLHNLAVFSSASNLRSLWLEKVIVPSLPSMTSPLSNLRKISLVLCEFRNIHESLLDTPLMIPRLSELTMDHCIGLTELASSICWITSLKSLSITHCHDLHDLPPELGKLNGLVILRLCACPALKILPDSICGLHKLIYLDISQCVKLKSLPERIGGLTKLEKIDMRGCSQIRNLPSSVVAMRQLCRVTCDEEASKLWKYVEGLVPDLLVEVAKEFFDLDWL